MKARHMKKDNTKKIKTLTIVLIVLSILVTIFTAVMIWLYIKTGGIPDTLCGCFFAATTGEFGVMGWIRTTKDRDKRREYELEDRKHEEDKLK